MMTNKYWAYRAVFVRLIDVYWWDCLFYVIADRISFVVFFKYSTDLSILGKEPPTLLFILGRRQGDKHDTNRL